MFVASLFDGTFSDLMCCKYMINPFLVFSSLGRFVFFADTHCAVINSEVHHLGYKATEAYGIVWKVGITRF